MAMAVAVAPTPLQGQAQGQQDYHSLVLSCNKDGMDNLRGGELKAAFEHFKYAESILLANQADTSCNSLLAVTCNNLGCYYKKTGKLHGALSYLRKALKMEEDLGTDEVTLAGTHLNICAILSKLQKHDKAVQHATSALELINARLSGMEESQRTQDDYSVLAIAYHNIAMERDFLEDFAEAASAFKQGHEIASRHLGDAHPLTITLGQSSVDLLQKCQKTPPASLAGSRLKNGRNGWTSSRGRAPLLPKLALPQEGATSEADVPMPQATVRQEAAQWVASSALAADLTLVPRAPAEPKTELLQDLVDADTNSLAIASARIAPNDCRPNRVIRGATRAARVARRIGTEICTTHRDQVMSGQPTGATAQQRTAYHRRLAAERIQRVWRSWYKYCQENHDWMVATHVSAVLIQSRWRSYHVRRQKFDRAAGCIQRHARGMIVRKVLARFKAAAAIQKRARGMVTRNKIRKMNVAATKIESLARGAAGRRAVHAKRQRNTVAALRIQCAVRRMIAKRVVGERRAIRNTEERRQKAATDIQRLARGVQGRKRFRELDAIRMQKLEQSRAATKLQSMARRDAAIKRADNKRSELLARMHVAATRIRKMYVGYRTRVVYREHLKEFAKHEAQVRTMQRYARGFLVRLRMWREATRAEEELWAATEIQRVWRGYLGRVRWESKYEVVWRRETSAIRIQKLVRGFVVRCRINRFRRRIAREEFDRARKRFRAAQRIQALSRGVLTRKVTSVRRWQKVHAATEIQRIWQGHRLRQALWAQVLELRATIIQANVRGFLTRNRFYNFIAFVICIQRSYRRWRRKPEAFRREAFEAMRLRKKSAAIIQQTYKKQRESAARAQAQAKED
eukprot:TRINITY_DN4021_c0_g1_i3.p1 TRINITY_DN4021_c0_g1~~TRINITY_DN4021_c0_g1_i3.p1  ORF type:complete len:856 (-),score=115.70 TRINITY_DN4021_c0_g1_i3:103-2670(-)